MGIPATLQLESYSHGEKTYHKREVLPHCDCIAGPNWPGTKGHTCISMDRNQMQNETGNMRNGNEAKTKKKRPKTIVTISITIQPLYEYKSLKPW